MAGLPSELMSKVGRGEMTMQEAWDAHRAGSDGPTDADGDPLSGVQLTSAEFGRPDPGSEPEPGRRTGVRKELACGAVVTSEAGEDTAEAVAEHDCPNPAAHELDEPEPDDDDDGDDGDGSGSGGGSGGGGS